VNRLKLFSAVFVLSAGMATPVFAQAAIQEPGLYSFYHPDGNLLHAGPTRPAPDAMAMVVPYARHGMRAMGQRAAAKRHDRFEVR